MNYPIYDKNDLLMVPKVGTYEFSDFHDLLSNLLEMDLLEHQAEISIAKYVLSNGTKNLSQKQSAVMQKVTKRYCEIDCSRCGLEIPLSEVIFSLDNSGFCDYCNHQIQKDD